MNAPDSQEPIQTLEQFRNWAEKQKALTQNESSQYFFRGHSDVKYIPEPSVYRLIRGKSFRASECHLYHEMLRRSPESFAEDKTVFEHLVRMQHYTLPTRLLDLTRNPLVALFFACQTSKREKTMQAGEVMSFSPPSKLVVYQSFLSEQCLVGFKSPIDFLDLFHSLYGQYTKIIYDAFEIWGNGAIQHHCTHSAIIRQYYSSCVKMIEASKNFPLDDCKDIHQIFLALHHFEMAACSFSNAWKKQFDAMLRLGDSDEEILLRISLSLQKIQTCYLERTMSLTKHCSEFLGIDENHASTSIISFLTPFCMPHFVLPPLNNLRIQRQEGAFLLFPPCPIEKSLEMQSHTKPMAQLIIPAESKQKLLAELSFSGITEDYLFPELDKLAQEIQAMYPEQIPTAICEGNTSKIDGLIEYLEALKASLPTQQKAEQ